MNALDSIAELLHLEYGFDASHPGTERLRRMVSERCQATDRPTPEEYLFLLENSREERDALLETIIVPETYFFRHRESFHALVDWARRRNRFPVRILSAACSTGEEAYSIAMALLDAGFTAEQFHIEGCDVSPASLEYARHGVYTGKAFRSDDQEWRERYFTATQEGWKINQALRPLVHFRLGNLLTFDARGTWDAIFCRNVMIYFSPARQKQVVDLLGRALAEGGLLFLGPAEPPIFLANGWTSSGYTMSFSCLRQPASSAAVPVKTFPKSVPPLPRKRSVTSPPAPAAEPPLEEDPLEAARRLADAGRLQEAEAALIQLCQTQPQNADAYFLSGLVAETQERNELAESHYRKALYLAPGHAETLRHMALLLRHQGRKLAAENLLRRAGRHTVT